MNTKLYDNLRTLERALNELDKPLSFREACQYLDCSKSYLYKITRRGIIPLYKPGGKKIYFLKSDLNGFLLRNKTAEPCTCKEPCSNCITDRPNIHAKESDK